jgi:hypothetical protein
MLILESSTSQPFRNLKASVKAKTVTLYSQILKYQMLVSHQYSRSRLFRYLRDCVIADDWKVMRADLIKTEESINSDLNNFGSNTLKVINDKVSELASGLGDLIKETKADVMVRTLIIE